jgi:hypothetical protein
MPLSYEVDLGKNLIVVRGEKGLSYDDVIKYQRELAQDTRISRGMLSLVDLRGLTAFEMAGRDVFNLAQSHGESPFFSSEGRTAVVVSDSTTFAMTRMYMLSRSKNAEPMAIFYDLDEARRWLGLEAVESSPQVIDQ